MIGRAISNRALTYVVKQAHRSSFAPLLGAVSFAATVTMSLPVELIVVAGTLASRRAWVGIAVWAAAGSALAATGLYFAFHHLGWSLLAKSYPDLALTQAWRQATVFLSQYGTVAIFAVMALPLPVPKLALLAVAGIYRLPVLHVSLAIFSGKLIKYILYAYLALRFPGFFQRLAHRGHQSDAPQGVGLSRSEVPAHSRVRRKLIF